MMVLESRLTERQLRDTQRKARAMRERMPAHDPGAKVEVDAAALQAVLTFVTEARHVRPGVAPARATPVADDEITPREAAAMLNMSRPSVMRLIALGQLHTRKVLSRNKLSRREVMDYHRRTSSGQRQALERLSALSEEHDF